MTPEDAAELFEIGPRRDRDEASRRLFEGCVARLAEPIRERVVRILRPHERVLRRRRVSADDGAQDVLRKLVESPPLNPHGSPPARALQRWVRTVATNWMRDHARRRAQTSLDIDSEEGGTATPAAVVDERTPESMVASRRDAGAAWEHAERCRDHALNQTQRACWTVLTTEPNVSGNELARRLGICQSATSTPTPAQRNSADQHKIRTLRRMRACLERCGVDLSWAARGAQKGGPR